MTIPDYSSTLSAGGLRGAQILPASADARRAASSRQRELLKPPGSLGRLEELAIHYAAARGKTFTELAGAKRPPRMALAVFAADHGVAHAGVSAYPQAVTAQMVASMASGGAAISVLAASEGIALALVDVGVAFPIPELTPGMPHSVHTARIGAGTGNLAEQPAMTAAELEAALTVGARTAQRLIAAGAELLGIGEVGIGNTTAAAAQLAALTGSTAELTVGRGTGVDDAGLARKRAVVAQALARAAAHLHTTDGVLCELSGFELVAMTGFILAAATARVPVVLDGFLATSAAVAAKAYAPRSTDYMYAAHCSAETGARIALSALNLAPLLDLGLRLGEGTGAVLGMALVSKALQLEAGMATFASVGLPTPPDPSGETASIPA